MNVWLLILPLLSALAAWLIIRLSFRTILRSSKLFQKFMEEVRDLVRSEIPNTDDMERKISDPAVLKTASPLIEKHVDDFLRIRLSKEMPFISHFIGDKTISSLKNLFMQE